MPEVVKVCYASQRKHKPENVEHILITLKNYQQYIQIPDYIVDKYEQGYISAAHFSDVIRFCLLSKYGGMWLDSTVYVSSDIPINYVDTYYYTQKADDPNLYLNEPSRAQWCGFIWGGSKYNPVFAFVRDALFLYWEKHNLAIDYIFFDYIILEAYKEVESIKEMIEGQEANNEEIWALWKVINDVFDPDEYAKICSTNLFHKLSYKRRLVKHIDEQCTYYGHIYNDYTQTEGY